MAAIKQISIFAENKPGRMAGVAKALGDAGVNIRALTIAEAGDFGVVRMVVEIRREDIPRSVRRVLWSRRLTFLLWR